MKNDDTKTYSLAMNSNESIKFRDYIANYIIELQRKLSIITEQLKIITLIGDSVNASNNIEALLDHQEEIVLFDKSLEEDLSKLRFFIEENAQDLPQYKELKNKILNNNLIVNYETRKNRLQNEKGSYEIILNKCQAIIDDINYDETFLIDLLMNSNLSEEERIAILCQEAYKSCKFVVTKEPKKKKIVPKATKVEPKDENALVDVSDFQNQFSQLLEQVDALIGKYYTLINGKKQEDYKYAQLFINYMREERENQTSEEIDLKDMRNIEAALILGLLVMRDTKNDFNNLIKKIKSGNLTTRDDAELMEIYLDDLKEYYDFSLLTVQKYDAFQQEENNVGFSNVIFLLSNDGKPIINIPENSNENKKRAYNLIEKLSFGKYDYTRGVAHSRIVTRGDITLDIFVNRDPVMACAYVRLTDNLILIISIDAVEAIYDDAQRHFRRNADVITKLKEVAATKTAELLKSQQDILIGVEETLNIREKV